MSERDERQELLPCPFCGSEARQNRHPLKGSGEMLPTITCTNEECDIEFWPSDGHNPVEAWNRRTERPNRG